MTQFDLFSHEYLLEIEKSTFQLNFTVDDSFYNQEHAAVSIKEIITEGQPDEFLDHDQVIKIVCKNRSHPVYNKLAQLEIVTSNLALVQLKVQKAKCNLFTVNSAPTIVPISARRIEFQIVDLLNNRPMDFVNAHCKRIFVRVAVTPVARR